MAPDQELGASGVCQCLLCWQQNMVQGQSIETKHSLGDRQRPVWWQNIQCQGDLQWLQPRPCHQRWWRPSRWDVMIWEGRQKGGEGSMQNQYIILSYSVDWGFISIFFSPSARPNIIIGEYTYRCVYIGKCIMYKVKWLSRYVWKLSV